MTWVHKVSNKLKRCELMMIAAPSYGGDFASVTISLSVYVAPAAMEEPLEMANQSYSCDQVLTDPGQSQVQDCQEGATSYTWRSSQDGIVLTIAPI